MHIAKDNAAVGQTFIRGEVYLILGAKLKPKAADFTWWKDFDKIKSISDRIRIAKSKSEGQYDLSIIVKLDNIIGEKNHYLQLKKEPEIKEYKYINTDTKKIDEITFKNFRKLFDKNGLEWTNSEFKYKILLEGEKLIQRLHKKYDEEKYLSILSEFNNYWILIDGKTYSSVDWIWYFYKRLSTLARVNFKKMNLLNLEKFRRSCLRLEGDISKKLGYTTHEIYKTLKIQQKKPLQ